MKIGVTGPKVKHWVWIEVVGTLAEFDSAVFPALHFLHRNLYKFYVYSFDLTVHTKWKQFCKNSSGIDLDELASFPLESNYKV